jgi:hypothetical protein
LDQGLRSINFFNGRLLSGEDLTAEQVANREGRQRLGQALGDGIAYGLEVSQTPGANSPATPVVTVTPGLAVNRRGQTLLLPTSVDVSLLPSTSAGSAETPCTGFGQCDELDSRAPLTGAGVYVLLISQAEGSEGRAPVSGLGNTVATCNTRYLIEGVQFRRLRLPASASELNDENHLRNRVAYRCFGSDDSRMQSFLSNPFGLPLQRYGWLDDLRSMGLTDCDVPLAVLYWTPSDGLRFIDLWSVRRRITHPSASERWPLLVGDRRMSEAEAMFLQFQDQIAALQRDVSGLGNLAAEEHFTFLPPAGYLPTGASGFDWRRFLGPMAPLGETVLDAGLLRAVVRRSFQEDPISVGSFANALQANMEPPVPVNVYRVPSQSDFVLFARSFHGRIRVFIMPPNATPQTLYAQAAQSNTQLVAGPRTGNIFPIVDVPSGSYAVTVEAQGFEAIAPVPVAVVGGRTTDVVITLQPVVIEPAQPRRCITIDLYGRKVVVCMQPDALTISRPPRGDVRELQPPPDDMVDWLKAWRDWLVAEFPDMGLDRDATPQVFVDEELPRFLIFESVTRKLQLYVEFSLLQGARFAGVIVPLTIANERG